jgi:hypothetical protein
MRFRWSACAIALVTVLGSTATLQVSSVSPAAAVESGARIAVDRSVDPDGFLLNPDYLRPASELPPVCVSAEDEHPDVGLARVVIRNGCTAPQRVKIIIAFWFDSACLIVPPDGTREYEYSNAARFDGLESC